MSRRASGEEAAQIELMQWVEGAIHNGGADELRWLYHTPSGMPTYKSTASRFKAMGVRKGVPDLHLPVARHGFCSLWIEMKVFPRCRRCTSYPSVVGFDEGGGDRIPGVVRAQCWCKDTPREGKKLRAIQGLLDPDQIEWIEMLREKGDKAEVAVGMGAAATILVSYLGLSGDLLRLVP